MSYYASFHLHCGYTFRLDTRIYLADGAAPGPLDICVAAIVGKNPGSASSSTFGVLAPLTLSDDKMLPSVRNRFIAAYRRASKPIPAGAFVRVWNLFYLCDPKLASAIRIHRSLAAPLGCLSESTVPSIVWYAWGGDDPTLNPLKSRFRPVTPAHAFFYDKNKATIITGHPGALDFPKHPQGLPEEPIVHFLSAHL